MMLEQEGEPVEQLARAVEQVRRVQRLLDSCRADILPKNPRNFAVFAEGPLDEIRTIPSLTVARDASPPPNHSAPAAPTKLYPKGLKART